MRANSVGTVIESGNVGGNHLLSAAVQMPVAEVHTVAEVDDLLQKIRPVSEALQNSGKLVPPRICLPPTSHDLGELAGGFALGSGFDEGHGDIVAASGTTNPMRKRGNYASGCCNTGLPRLRFGLV